MTLIVRCRPILATQIIRVYRTIRKRNLIVIGIVERARQRVRRSKLVITRKTLFETQQQTVILRSHTRLEVLHDLWSTDDRIEMHGADNTPDDEVCADVTHVVSANREVLGELTLYADVHLVDHRVL